MNLTIITSSLKDYENLLVKFLKDTDLYDLIDRNIDHVAVKLADSKEYESFISGILPLCETLQYITMHERRLATAILVKPLKTDNFGECFWLEIMEPKPSKVGKDFVGLEHTEILVNDLNLVKEKLMLKKIEFEDYDNGYHKALVCIIGNRQEVKFTDTKISEVIEHERRDGRLVVLK